MTNADWWAPVVKARTQHADPLPPGQSWVISSGGADENPGLYQVDITEGPGTGVKILNQPASPAFRESVRCAEQNLYVRAKELVGDRDPRQHEFSVQLRAFDSANDPPPLNRPA